MLADLNHGLTFETSGTFETSETSETSETLIRFCKNKKAFPVKETLFHNVFKNYFLAISNTKLKRKVFESGLRFTPDPVGKR